MMVRRDFCVGAVLAATLFLASPSLAANVCPELDDRSGSVVTGTVGRILIYTYSADHLTVCVTARGKRGEVDLGTAYWQAADYNQPFVKLKGIDTPPPEHWQRPRRYAPHEVIWPEGVTPPSV